MLYIQRQIIEQAKFTYSPLRKTLEKQTQTIEDKGKKQIKAIEDHEEQLAVSNTLIKKNDCNTENELFLKKKKLFHKFVAERNNKINSLKNIMKYDKLTYYFKSENKI